MVGSCPPIIFLDIDGVLNAHDFSDVAMSNTIDREKVAILNRILKETGARIVLSSAWRYIVHRGEANLDGMDWLLRSHGVMCGRLIGLTRPDTMMPTTFDGTPCLWPLENERGDQIWHWLTENKYNGTYVVIDDGGEDRVTKEWTDLGIDAGMHPVVWTKGNVGLTQADADLAIAILAD